MTARPTRGDTQGDDAMAWMDTIDRCALIGMVHLKPLPGSPGWRGDRSAIFDAAMRDAEALLEGGCDALIVENMGDVPYLRQQATPETIAMVAIATDKIAKLGRPVGVQVLAGANREALGVAVSAGAQFIRVEGFAYGHLADEGWMNACAGTLLRARSSLGTKIEIWADVQKKHASHVMTSDLNLQQMAQGTAFCGADVLIATGIATTAPAVIEDVIALKDAGLPVVVGSGITADNAVEYANQADALIVGSHLKIDGDWRNRVSLSRVKSLAGRLGL